MATAKDNAQQVLLEAFDKLPLKLSNDEKTQLADCVYDFVRELLSAVSEEYHVVYKHD